MRLLSVLSDNFAFLAEPKGTEKVVIDEGVSRENDIPDGWTPPSSINSPLNRSEKRAKSMDLTGTASCEAVFWGG
ncbi:Unannotated [Lentimonas sp. CC19]|nr:Unannotated [Lentimonas sp. CC4]CAA6684554.1 Unannotated [Lentimonas sp. CC6]CAA6694142.1 Unannotated [Lentimonas sp. CC10]CAA6694359.1 Unannotated [Lentimonas sp. CC19]CAA7071102.1 Unannotated [Lentimonas sp. CC11]CAA7170576.1 Unannotated [Lentimonas sp. CC21]CAA7183216.1 Unannotated [Lentimonas sp. CC8]